MFAFCGEDERVKHCLGFSRTKFDTLSGDKHNWVATPLAERKRSDAAGIASVRRSTSMNKKILILSGSPRKNGNTAMLVDWFADGARSKGARV